VGISVERACDGNVITLNHRLRMMVRGRAWRWVPRRIVVHQDYCAVLLRNECSISDGHHQRMSGLGGAAYSDGASNL
jgi:hypothetical protein